MSVGRLVGLSDGLSVIKCGKFHIHAPIEELVGVYALHNQKIPIFRHLTEMFCNNLFYLQFQNQIFVAAYFANFCV